MSGEKYNGRKQTVANLVDEILAGIRDGRLRMTTSRCAPLERRLPSTGEWIRSTKYHPLTIRAAQRRMVYSRDPNALSGRYEFPEE